MTQAELIQHPPLDVTEPQIEKKIKAPNTVLRIARYLGLRILSLFLMVVVIVWLTIIVANIGGFADEVKKANIIFGLSSTLRGDPNYDLKTPEQQAAYLKAKQEAAFRAAGLDDPFLLRSVYWLWDGLTLGWGARLPGTTITFFPPIVSTRALILEALPKTLYLFASANILLFVVTVGLSLRLIRAPASWTNRIVTLLAPLSTVPPWIMGLVLYALMLRLRWFDLLAGSFDSFPVASNEGFSIQYLLMTLKFLILPVSAIFVSKFFHSIYSWRSFFSLYENEPYVELARAKGLKPNVIERKYIVRAALPAILTSFALVMASLWQEVVILEKVFDVSGVGSLFVGAVESLNIGLVVACVTTFGYLLAITIFILDISYALVDPRITVSTEGNTVGALKSTKRKFWEPRPRTVHAPREPFKLSAALEGIGLGFRSLTPYIKEILRTPSAVLGLIFIIGLIIVAIWTVITIPYDTAVAQWRGDNGIWENTPKNAEPIWINWFTKDDYPESMMFDSRNGDATVEQEVLSDTQTRIVVDFALDYPYGAPPEDLVIRLNTQYDDKIPFISMKWTTPDGREIDMGSLSVPKGDFSYYILQDTQLMNKLKVKNIPDITKAMFADPAKPDGASMKGTYHLRISGIFFDTANPKMDARLSLQGKVYGWAGTDAQNRDLMLPLLWGTPVALLFGIIGAFGTSIAMVVLAAISTWFGGWVDNLIQRLTEMNMILPFFPFAVMVFVLYSKSIWVILAVTVLLSIFGSSIKTYRAMFLQTKQSPYIEAARSYGASDWRIIFVYLIPRVVVLLIPQIMILIPSYVFLEAALAALGVSDPFLPTWGKLIAVSFQSLFAGNYYKVFGALLLMATGYAFAMVGFSVERRFRKDTEMA